MSFQPFALGLARSVLRHLAPHTVWLPVARPALGFGAATGLGLGGTSGPSLRLA